MAYRSLFNPINEEESARYMQNHSINEDAFNQPAPAAVVNPAQQAQAAAPSATVVNPAQQAQTVQGAQPNQQAQIIVPKEVIAQLGPSIQKVCPGVLKDVATMTAWNQFAKSSNSLNDLIGFITAFAQYAGNAIAAQGQQAPVQQGAAQPAQQAQPTQNVSSSYKPILKNDRWALIREKARENMLLESQDDGSDDEKPAKKEEPKSDTSNKSTSSKSDEFHDDKDVDYSSEYNEEVSGKKGETTVEYKDKQMYQSIFGTSEDPFQDEKDVNYHQSYKEIGDKETERPDNTTYTKPEPFKTESPKLTSLSDATALSKTVFTIDDNGTIKDAGSSSEGKSKSVEDDGSEDDMKAPKAEKTNEGFYTSYDSHLLESIEPSLRKTIIREFINELGEDFDLGLFNDWIEEKYPKLAADPAAFDELVYAIQDHDGKIEEDDTDDTDDTDDIDLNLEGDDDDDKDDLEDQDDDFNSDETYIDIANEYLDDVDNDEYDEDDAIAWCEDNYPEIADNNDELDNFLDAVCNLYSDDDINESLNDEFYANEGSIA